MPCELCNTADRPELLPGFRIDIDDKGPPHYVRGMEWIFTTVLLLAGLVGAIGLYLGLSDPATRPYKPGIWGLFGGGRATPLPEDSKPHDPDTKDIDNKGPRDRN